MKFAWLGGLIPEAVKLLREVIKAVRAGDPDRAARLAREAAQREAEVRAFIEIQKRKRDVGN